MIRTVEVTRIQQRARIVTTGGLVAALLALPLPLPGDAQAISAPAIASQSAVGVPTLAAAAAVAPALIAGNAVVRAPAIAAGAAAIGVPAILPAGIVAAPIVAAVPGQAVAAPAIVGASVVAAPILSAVPGQAIVAPAIVSAGVVPSPSVTGQGVATIAPALLASGSVVRAPAIGAGGVSLAPASLVSTAIVRAPTVITNPAPFAFDQDKNVDPGIGKASNEITLDMGGSMVPVTVTVSGTPDSTMLKNGVDIGAQPTTGVHGDRFRVIHTSSTSYSTTKGSTLTAGTTSATYTTTTKAEVVASLDPATQAAVLAMSVQPTATRAKLYDDLIVGLKADGIWSQLDWLILHAAHDAQAGRVNLIAPSRIASAINSPTFTMDRGYTGDGGTSYLSTGQAWGTGTSKFIRNNAMLGVWVNVASTDSQSSPIGMEGTNSSQVVYNNDGSVIFRVNSTGTSPRIVDPNQRVANRAVVRREAENIGLYTNGQFVGEQPSTSANPSSASGTILRGNNTYANGCVAAAYSGAAVTAAQIAALHNRLSTFLTAIGAA